MSAADNFAEGDLVYCLAYQQVMKRGRRGLVLRVARHRNGNPVAIVKFADRKQPLTVWTGLLRRAREAREGSA